MRTNLQVLILGICLSTMVTNCKPSISGSSALSQLKTVPVPISNPVSNGSVAVDSMAVITTDTDGDGPIDIDSSAVPYFEEEIADVIPRSRMELSSMRMVRKSYDGKNNAGVQLPGFGGIKLGKDEAGLSVYFIESSVVNNNGKNETYGCGYSVHYHFKKVTKGIDINNLANVAAAAQLNSGKTQVYYSIQTYGISGKSLAKYFKPVVNQSFNVEGFGLVQASIDGIHAIISDDELSRTVKFTPERISELSLNDFN